MNKIMATAALIAMALSALTVEANAAAGGFCRSTSQEAPICQR